MTHNIGTIDRTLRIVAGLVLLALAWIAPVAIIHGTAAVAIATVIGLVLIVTAFLRVCPLYSMLGMNTCAVK